MFVNMNTGRRGLVAQYDVICFDEVSGVCLLYTSDAADERSSVDLGGRRIIKKKKKKTTIRDIADVIHVTHEQLVRDTSMSTTRDK